MAFYQWKLSIGNGILSVEIFHGKWHFTSGNFTRKNMGCTQYLRIWVLAEKYSLTIHFNGNNDTHSSGKFSINSLSMFSMETSHCHVFGFPWLFPVISLGLFPMEISYDHKVMNL